MKFVDHVTWVSSLPWIGVAYIVWDALPSSIISGSTAFFSLLTGTLVIFIENWLGQVMQHVPEPYMDEVFHIPQAQAYCVGDFHVWDPKLTTPPGLYAFTAYFCNLAGIRTCDVHILRAFNGLVLLFLLSYAGSCHARIHKLLHCDANSLHTVFNIALFPPLFFFSALFYTDVLSTCLILRMYRLYLARGSGIWLYLAGMLSLTMRQTNIFWAAIFMGGLEAVRTLHEIKSTPGRNESSRTCWQGTIAATFHQYARGAIHDIPLKDAEIYDFALCAISIIVAAVHHPLLILRRLWPYMALLISFFAFVLWNGSVVLGDKTAHVATLHLPQLLYLWPFIAFFSLPLLVPTFISLIPRSTALPKLTPLRILLTLSTLALTLLAILATIHFNTLVHPYILADNRHYMFYVFRYTILRHPLIRYLFAPAYILAFYLTYRTLARPTILYPTLTPKSKPTPIPNLTALPYTGPTTSFLLILILASALSLITAPLVEPRYFILPWVLWRLHVPGSPRSRPQTKTRGTARKIKRWVGSWTEGRLWAETAWFLVINLVTGWIFLHRGFKWESEEGVQRFLW